MDSKNNIIFDTTQIGLFVKKDPDASITSNSLRSLNSSCEEVKDTSS